MFNLILKLKTFTPIGVIKKRLTAAEFFLDLLYYYRTKLIFRRRHFEAFRSFKIDYQKDLALVFFVGIGDVIYGLPMLLELKKMLHRNGAKFHAYVEETPSNFNNPAVFHVLKATQIFDSVTYFHGRKLPYWKYFDWTSIKLTEDIRILPFIYRTNSKVKDRVIENFRQFSLEPSISWPKFEGNKSETFESLIEIIKVANNKNIFIHLETRSGDYKYPFLNDFLQLVVSSKVLIDKMTLVVFKSKDFKLAGIDRDIFKGQSDVVNYKNFEVIEFVNGNKIIFLDPTDMQFSDQVSLIQNYCNILLAINSYLWPISKMLNKELVGIHYLDSADGHQFLDEKAFVITPSQKTYRKLENSILALEGVDYTRVPTNPLMVEYFPETIYWALLQRAYLA